MAKEKRFPSPANVAVDKQTGKPIQAAKPVAGQLPSKPVIGKVGEHVSVVSHLGAPIVLHNGVHALAKGLNTVAKEVMDEAVKHPHIAKLIQEGKILIGKDADKAVSDSKQPEAAPAEEKAEEHVSE